jgi:hypothetical protein
MMERFDHRPMLTALLALSTSVLVMVVLTLATLLITGPQAASPSSLSDSGNHAAPAPKVMDAGSYGEVYGWNIHNRATSDRDAQPANHAMSGTRGSDVSHLIPTSGSDENPQVPLW